jgi:aryl-alcohol dehydrogenase-like predicted oxidoreductase
MNYRTLGRTDIEVSEVGLGTWAFNSRIYGEVDAGDNGISEEILGAALGADREHVVISTKFGRYSTDGAARNFHARRARHSVEGSLARMDTDWIDVLFFHSPFGPEDIHDDVWEELDRLKSEGKVRFIGHSVSMFAETQQMARDWAEERRIDVVQVVYSLMNRESSALITDLGSAGVGIVARESLANGFLSGMVRPDTTFPKGHLNARYSREEIASRVEYVDTLRFLVRGDVTSVPMAAYRWVLDNPHVALVLSGAKNEAELAATAAASDVAGYSMDELERADDVHVRDFQAA